jgi:hypothetical protein
MVEAASHQVKEETGGNMMNRILRVSETEKKAKK